MLAISVELVTRLIREQFPQWADLPIRPVAQSGHDNRTFYLGENMTVRLPSGAAYVPQIEKEAEWLPYLARFLSLPISCPIVRGRAGGGYPFVWSINRFVEGETLCRQNTADLERLAVDLAAFLRELQRIDTRGAPAAGAHNFYRGAEPAVYSRQVESALRELETDLPVGALKQLWQRATATRWTSAPVWLHGDVAPGNILVRDGTLCGVIDFGIMGVGDPACDYAMAWTFFDRPSRVHFLEDLDPGTIDRARGWALWKALITYRSSEPEAADSARHTLDVILEEYDRMMAGG